VDRHLITVKVGIVGRTYKRMELNGLPVRKYRLESLNTETMKSRGAVKHNRVFTDHLIQYIPDLCPFLFNHFFSVFDGSNKPALFQLIKDEGLEELQRHLLRDSALVQLQLRADNNN